MLSNGTSTKDFFSKNLKNRKQIFTIKEPSRTIDDDLKFGYKSEEELIQILNNYFDDSFRNTKELYGQYCNYDFEGAKGFNRIELKTRRNKYNDYPTTIIPVHKTVGMDLCPNTFIFNFSDGIYYIEWNTNKFKTYEKKMIQYNRIGRTDNNEHYLIPIEDLIKLE